jgi:DNA mismatch endonuclease (patch repair protein)
MPLQLPPTPFAAWRDYSHMADMFDPAMRSWIMSRVPSRGSKPEAAVELALRHAGVRLSSRRKPLPGNPDFVVASVRLAVFVNGCFWHWHGCPRCRMPQANRLYWERKIARNLSRDRKARRALTAAGWHYWTVWECRLRPGIARLLARIHALSR